MSVPLVECTLASTNILYRGNNKTRAINCIESLSLSSIVHSITILENIAKSCDHSWTNRPRRDGQSCIAKHTYVRDPQPGSLKVFRRKTRPFLIFSMQAAVPPRAHLIHSISRIFRLIYGVTLSIIIRFPPFSSPSSPQQV